MEGAVGRSFPAIKSKVKVKDIKHKIIHFVSGYVVESSCGLVTIMNGYRRACVRVLVWGYVCAGE